MPRRPGTHSTSRTKTKTHQAPATVRENSAQRGYGYKWQQARAGFLKKHPLCVYCLKKDKVTAATDVDHIIPHKGDMDLFWQRSNWQPLCGSCHSAKTAREDGGFGNRKGEGGSKP